MNPDLKAVELLLLSDSSHMETIVEVLRLGSQIAVQYVLKRLNLESIFRFEHAGASIELTFSRFLYHCYIRTSSALIFFSFCEGLHFKTDR